ncbi:MAG TPA: LCP family protein [Candidatus Limnocylindrales bacterium]
MPIQQEARPRWRSAFAAAFLSLIFPGLGHLYAGAAQRALGFAALPILLLSLLAGIVIRSNPLVFLGTIAANLPLLLLLNVLILLYRIVAAVDAYRVAAYLNAVEATGGSRLSRPRLATNPVSVAGLLAVLLVLAGGHAVVAYQGIGLQNTLSCIFDPSGTANCADIGSSASPGNDQGDESPTPSPSDIAGTANPSASAPPLKTPPPWNGKDRLNILLIGADQRPHEGTFNTDTLIVVSIDPTSKQVAMFSLPRDMVDIPLPPGPAQNVFGAAYRGKINSLWTTAQSRPDLFPGNANQRGFQALKDTLAYLYNLKDGIKYYVEVNFDGFRRIVDAVGGVNINVQMPVLDDKYPGGDGTDKRIYIPTGLQHMTGDQALTYARSRHTSNDFDRGARQQRVLLSLRQQTDVSAILPKLNDLEAALVSAVKTDIPIGLLPQLLGLAGDVDTSNIRQYVFAPPLYGHDTTADPRGYVILPNIIAMRQAVAQAFRVDPALEQLRQKVAEENAKVWVLNGSGQTGQANDIADYLTYAGVDATAPNQQPRSNRANTSIVVYNGADARIPQTIALLQQVFKVQVTLRNDPAVRVDVIVTTGRSTPDYTPPPYAP